MKTLIPWSLVAILSAVLLLGAQENSAAGQPQQSSPPPRGAAGEQDLGARMVEAIKGTEGCLGVTTGELSGGREAIFAFFEDKAAALRWYHHPMHQQLRGMMGDAQGGDDYVPLKNVPDGVPVLTVASISFAGEPAMKDSQIPFSSISIELYVPVNGGLRINGGFAPEKFSQLAQEPKPDAAKLEGE